MMTRAYKIAWKDGMFIYPHHFQQQDIYYDNLLKSYHTILPFYNWGILQLEIEESYLKLNKLIIRKCIGVFADGTAFSIPDKNDVPCTIEIPKDYNNKFIYLGLPIKDKYSLNSNPENTGKYAKYYLTEEEFNDVNSEVEDKKPILINKLNINLFLEENYLAPLTLIPIIKVIDASDGVLIDPDYISPCLRVNSSNILLGYIAKIFGLLSNYVTSNSQFMSEENASIKVNQIENLIITQTVNKFKYLFELMLKDKMLTPYLLFERIVSLIGSLSIFAKNQLSYACDIHYDHSNLFRSFEPLIKIVSLIFKELNEYAAIQITFKQEENGVYTAKLNSAQVLHDSEIIIGIELTSEEKKEYDNIIKSLKIASIKEIKRLISLQVSGAGFYLINSLPPYISYNNRTLYFKLKQEGNFWSQILSDKDIALHLNYKVIPLSSVRLWIIPPQLTR
jgi:type VI secretion system protein ImpJ